MRGSVTEIRLDRWTVHLEDLRLEHEGETYQLEPRAMDLLLFLVNNRGKVISRDSLIENVWGGTIVSDHAVTSCIAKIRKVFNKENSNKNVIETISKRGYRLNPTICVEFLETEAIPAPLNTPSPQAMLTEGPGDRQLLSSRSPKLLFTYTGIVILAGMLAFAIYSQFTPAGNPSSSYLHSRIEPMTSLNGLEYSPKVSTDGKLLSYLYKGEETADWSMHVMETDSRHIVTRIPDVAEYTRQAWSADNSSLIYHRITDEGCGIFVATLSAQPLGHTEKQVATCLPHSQEISFSWEDSDSLVYYNESPAPQEPRALHQLNIKTGKKMQISKPLDAGFGDYNPVYHQLSHSLYFLRNKYWKNETHLMQLDLADNRLTDLFRANQLINSFSLDDKGWPIYQSDRNSIVSLDPQRKVEQLIYRSLIPTKQPIFNSAGPALYFVSEANYEKDLGLYSLSGDGLDLSRVNTSRDDFSPVFANRSDLFALVSNQSGNPQIYVYDFAMNNVLTSDFDKEIIPGNLVWSEDDKRLFFTQKSEVISIELATAKVSRIPIPFNYVQLSIAPDSDEGFYFASDHDNDWQIYTYNKGDIQQVTEFGGYIGKKSHDDRYLYYSKFRKLGLWRKDLSSGAEELFIPGIDILIPGSFQVFEDSITYKLKSDSGFDVLLYDLSTGEQTRLAKVAGENERPFSVSHDRQYILYEKLIQDASADIVKLSL
ncbi:winged helix-turn-helix domain-containing protein [Bowmanella dokdonensis]|uniref:Winged helix-turn-helix domain-containing protein n=1 Tax=Bowmanella dokdonensis TaxID=751969 RepID=A0A939DJZ3_9ALTE|nr:winged helix-turn-helix domain-containing protein [Bowmanella dokdonensis]MBN7823929.1 winged helix-turn-helix domain-containing protein [Bowmanella dokdonensis]